VIVTGWDAPLVLGGRIYRTIGRLSAYIVNFFDKLGFEFGSVQL